MISISTPHTARVVVADDYEPQRDLLQALLSIAPGVEVVAVCRDGQEAVEAIVADGSVTAAVLDLNMPRTDGLAAAEFLRTYRPDVEVLLFTSEPYGEARRAADEIGLRVFDKLAADDLLAAVAEGRAPRSQGEGVGELAPLVLAALAAHTDESFVVVRADWTVVYYNLAAAELHGLPFPATGDLDFADLRRRMPTVYRDGTPRPPETRPVSIALAERRPVVDEVCELRDGEIHVYTARALPFFADGSGDFLGVAVYWRRIEQLDASTPE